MKKLSSILSFVLLFSCGNVQNHVKSFTNTDIIGKWILATKQINYPSLIFNADSTAIFNSMGDTVYRYKFYIDNSVLVLKDINGKETRDKIFKLDSDSLIFETLADNKAEQKYKRAK